MGGIPVNPLDLIFGFLLVFLTLRGLYNGLVREVATIVGILLGFFLANRLYVLVVPFVEKFISAPDVAQLTAYLAVLFATFLGVIFTLAMFRNVLHVTLMGGIDRFAGALLGFVKAYVICALVLVVLTTFLASGSETLEESHIAPFIDHLSASFSSMLPESLREEFGAKGQALQELWNTDWAETIRRNK